MSESDAGWLSVVNSPTTRSEMLHRIRNEVNVNVNTSDPRFLLTLPGTGNGNTEASPSTSTDIGIGMELNLDQANVTQHFVLITGSTPTTSEPTDEINSFYFYKTEQFTILWILFVMIVIGNSAVLITLTLNKSRKSRMNFFIKQLAIADLTVGLISVLTDIIWRMTVVWYAGNIACKVIRFLQATVTYSSTYVLVALSIDRYDAITHPMNFTGSWRRAKVLVISAWLISIIFSIPELFLFEEKHIEEHLQCWIDLQPWQWRVYMTLITFALLIVPALIISACYTVIVRTIWSKSKLLVPPQLPPLPMPARFENTQQQSNRRRRQSSSAKRTVVHRYDENDTRRASSRGIIPKAKIKTVKMTFVIVFVFVLCWSPYIVFDLLQVYGHIPRTQTSTAVATLIQSLAPLNSAANPLIYCLFSTRTCRTLRRSTTNTTHTIRVQTNNPAANSRHCKVAISVV